MILNGLSHTHDGAGGATVSGKITVQNNGKKEAKILIYREDMVVSCDKPVDYDKINSHDRSLGDWMQTNVEEKWLQSGEVYDVTYTVTVPDGVKGSYWSVVMIEGADPVKEDLIEKGVRIDSKVRYAVLVIANAGPVESPGIGFAGIKVSPKDSSSRVLQVKLRNNGLFVARTRLSIEIYDDAGKKIKTGESPARRTYPGKCTDFELVIKDLPKGKYEGVLIADNGKDLYGANMGLEVH